MVVSVAEEFRTFGTGHEKTPPRDLRAGSWGQSLLSVAVLPLPPGDSGIVFGLVAGLVFPVGVNTPIDDKSPVPHFRVALASFDLNVGFHDLLPAVLFAPWFGVVVFLVESPEDNPEELPSFGPDVVLVQFPGNDTRIAYAAVFVAHGLLRLSCGFGRFAFGLSFQVSTMGTVPGRLDGFRWLWSRGDAAKPEIDTDHCQRRQFVLH